MKFDSPISDETNVKSLLTTTHSYLTDAQKGITHVDWSDKVDYVKYAYILDDNVGYVCILPNGPNSSIGPVKPSDDITEVCWSASNLSRKPDKLLAHLIQCAKSTYLGDIQEFIVPKEHLLPGWIPLDGKGYLLTSSTGRQLQKVKESIWWGMLETGWTSPDNLKMCISLVENMIYAPDWRLSNGKYPLRKSADTDVITPGSYLADGGNVSTEGDEQFSYRATTIAMNLMTMCSVEENPIPSCVHHGFGGELSYLGDVKEFLVPKEYLPYGWFHMTGEGHAITSKVGIQLLKLKSEPWWMTLEDGWMEAADISMTIRQVGDIIYLPKWAHTDGRLPITRPVDGITRKVGSLEDDAIRNIIGAVSNGRGAIQCYGPSFTGAFTGVYGGSASWSGNVTGNYNLVLNTSRVVPTAPENRVLSRGTTIAINLFSHHRLTVSI